MACVRGIVGSCDTCGWLRGTLGLVVSMRDLLGRSLEQSSVIEAVEVCGRVVVTAAVAADLLGVSTKGGCHISGSVSPNLGGHGTHVPWRSHRPTIDIYTCHGNAT